ncbi:MAG: type VI secretion system contractile sheath large subunit, partial [Pseudomonadota bacterium]
AEPEAPAAEPAAATSDLDDLLADLDGDAPGAAEPEAPAAEPAAATSDLDDLLADLDGDAPGAAEPEAPAAEPATATSDLDDLLADLEADTPAAAEPEAPAAEPASATSDLDDLLADLEDEATPEAQPEPPATSDLDDLLADLEGESAGAEPPVAEEQPAATSELDDLLADLEDTEATPPADAPESAASGDLGAILTEGGAPAAASAPQPQEAEASYGTVSAPRPERAELNRRKFRIAVFGDFTGRAARGAMEIGPGLASRRAITLDVDDVEEMIEGFATTLTLPIGKDGAGIEVKLGELDDLDPDELYDNVEIFEELSGLRQQLGMGSMAARAIERLKAWGAEYDTPVRLPRRSASTSVPADRKLSDFQALIGDTSGRLTPQPSPIDEMIARIVGPYAVKAPDDGVAAMTAAVDEALSAAMRLVLHHPDFQAVEAQWRTLDLLARRIETDAELEIVLYDVSAEELGADLAAQEDLAECGLFKLLTDVLDPEEGRGGYSALFGLYTFEETPPHAELLGRLAQVAAHVDAPFVSAISPGYLEIEKQDRHRLVAKAWDTLRAMPQSGYIGLASPRFMLRLPYGKKTEPISAFEFEEFTPQEGLSGMLWANPAALVAILLAGTYKEAGRVGDMSLGSMMSLDDVPFYYITDRFGDQVALPCTERNLTTDAAQFTVARGFMPVLSMKGRNEIRLGSFRSLSGEELAGPWLATVPSGDGTPPKPTLEVEMAAGGAAPAEQSVEDMSLDDLLSGFGDDESSDAAGDDDMDPELAELLKGL